MTTVGITGASGLLGWHTRCHLRATSDVEVLAPGREVFEDEDALDRFVSSCDAVLHLAGINRGSDKDVLDVNRGLADSLIRACRRTKSRPHVVFADSTHRTRPTAYGKAKREIAEAFRSWAEIEGGSFTDVIFPHVFGEGGKPFTNSVVSTFCYQLAHDEEPTARDDGELELLHAQQAAAAMIDALVGRNESIQQVSVPGRPSTVHALLAQLTSMSTEYRQGVIPDLSERGDVELFNTLRSYLYPHHWPVLYDQKVDARGAFVELVKSEGGGQTSISDSHPGVTRGNHFHTAKVERFAVIHGEVSVQIRRLFDSKVLDFRLTSDAPSFVDIPTLHTHNLTNVGSTTLVMAFWSNEIFDPERPDTVTEPV